MLWAAKCPRTFREVEIAGNQIVGRNNLKIFYDGDMGGESLNVRDIDFTNYALSSLYTCIIRIVTVNYQGCDWTLELEQYSAALIYVCVWLHKCILVTEWQVRWIFINKFQVVCIMIGEWPDGYFYDEWTGVASWQVAFKVGASQWGLISTVSARTHPSFYLHVYMCVFMYHVCVCVHVCEAGPIKNDCLQCLLSSVA